MGPLQRGVYVAHVPFNGTTVVGVGRYNLPLRRQRSNVRDGAVVKFHGSGVILE